MPNLQDLETIIKSFLNCDNRSEAEIRSKLAVPLIDWLGYPMEFRAEEFPVHGYNGCTPITKKADFLLFDDKEYNSHTLFKNEDISWVQSHSLLVLETKKPDDMPKVLGQPQFYTIWTKAIAYIATDGNTIIGRIYNPLSKDIEIINCDVKDLFCAESINQFSYADICKIKKIDWSKEIETRIQNEELEGEIIDPETIELPENALSYMRNALGRNAASLSKGHIIENFLRTTDFYLQQDMRYDVPPYMFDIPRRVFDAMIYLDGNMIPFMKGEVYQYYRDELEGLSFQNDYIDIHILLSNDELASCSIAYHVLDYHASERIYNLQRVEKAFLASTIQLKYNEKSLEIPLNQTNLQEQLPTIKYWLDCMNMIKTIEEYYGINLILTPIHSPDESQKLYGKIKVVFDGIARQRNIQFSRESEKQFRKLGLNEPVTLPVDEHLHLDSLQIHNYLFKPTKIHLIPNKSLIISVEFYPEKAAAS